MSVEDLNGQLGLARLDAAKRSVETGEPLSPVPLATVVREAIPTTPTNRERRAWKRAWFGLSEFARQELGVVQKI